MAVTKEKMIERFKVLFPKVNLSKERLNMLMDKLKNKPADDAEDSIVDEVLNDYNEILPFSEIAKDDDKARKLSADKAKLEEDIRKGKTGNPNPEDTDDDDLETLPDDAPAWAKKVFEQNKLLAKGNSTLRSELDVIKSGNVAETRNQQLSGLFGSSEVLKGLTPEIQKRLMKTVDFDSETPLEDQIASIETEYSAMVQINADSNQYAGGAGSGSPDVKVDSEKVDKVLDNMRI